MELTNTFVAHAMCPIAGAGIKCAVRDAVVDRAVGGREPANLAAITRFPAVRAAMARLVAVGVLPEYVR